MNWRWAIGLIIIAVLLLAFTQIVISHADANDSYVEITTEEAFVPELTNYTMPVRIAQGDCVSPGMTIDISGMGWNNGRLDYFGPYFDYYSPYNNQTATKTVRYPFNINKSMHFYLNPSIFNNALGWWYVHYDSDESGGNSRAFYVSQVCTNASYIPVITQTMVNETNVSEFEPPVPKSPLEELWQGDILLGRGDYISITTPSGNESRIWVFGDSYSKYNYSSEQNVAVFDSTEELKGFAAGEYDAAIVDPGTNGIYEVEYAPEVKLEKYSNITHPMLMSPFRSVPPVDIYGFADRVVESRFYEMERNSRDDNVTSLRLILMEPEIRIMRIDQRVLGNGNYTYLDIRGYTNAVNGTPMKIYFDMNNVTAKYTWDVTAHGNYTGAWRQFNLSFLADFGDIFPGQHEVTITNPQGAWASVPVYVYRELPAHYQPPEYMEYIGNSPFVPTPTPEVIVQEKIVEKPVIQIERVVEKEPVDYEKLIETALSMAAPWLALGTGVIVIGYYGLTVIARARNRKNDEHEKSR